MEETTVIAVSNLKPGHKVSTDDGDFATVKSIRPEGLRLWVTFEEDGAYCLHAEAMIEVTEASYQEVK
jgi:preprotein translocase subunit YajC